MNTAKIATALKAKRSGDGWMARCPAHDDRKPSLSLHERDGRTLVKCFAGCDQNTVIDALRSRWLWSRVDNTNSARPRSVHPRPRPAPPILPNSIAKQIWADAEPMIGTSAERYLIARGIAPPNPSPLRFNPALDYFNNDAPSSAVKLPALIAAVQSVAGNVTAIQRIYLDPRGDRKAQISTPKKSLGPISGGAVRLAPAAPALALTEGVEDALALIQMTGQSAWAVLGTSNFSNFEPPPVIETIVLAPDADPAGDKAVDEAADRLARLGLRVLHLRPPEGADWCDVLGFYEERAAIREIDGGEDRAEAELAAFAEVIGGRLADA